MKTPKQMAEEWYWDNLTEQAPVVMLSNPVKHPPCPRKAFLAGYQAAKDETNLPTSARWISVKERLPEMNVVALVFSKLTYLNVAHRVVDDKGWCWATVSMSIAPYEITHWMPLPELPKGEE